MLISEELYLLLTKASGAQESVNIARSHGLAAALIADLLLAGTVALSDEKRPRVTVRNDDPTGNPVLDFGLRALGSRDGARLGNLITSTKLNPTAVVASSLISQGVLAEGRSTILGLGVPRTPEADLVPEKRLRVRLAQVLAGTAAPTTADATLLAIVHGLGAAKRILCDETHGMSWLDLKNRIKQISAEAPPADAIGRAVAATGAASG